MRVATRPRHGAQSKCIEVDSQLVTKLLHLVIKNVEFLLTGGFTESKIPDLGITGYYIIGKNNTILKLKRK
ncbi:hypothetical protein KQX54_015572 [Cotesia glomerata]|uniref:Uncharacterized protein n=1 Tax=Cotesia glomerata TaxID=32391 RepID=A0AAV7I6A6_COTGL|nr:hypothetical protein KQX54_015572 [Cotesia glomerata]